MSIDIEKSANLLSLTELTEDLADNDFYCAKCYDMVNYFIDECETLTPKIQKFERGYIKCKKCGQEIRDKYETLEFDYQEVKSQKEDFEERYNLLLNKLVYKEPSTTQNNSNKSVLNDEQKYIKEIDELNSQVKVLQSQVKELQSNIDEINSQKINDEQKHLNQISEKNNKLIQLQQQIIIFQSVSDDFHLQKQKEEQKYLNEISELNLKLSQLQENKEFQAVPVEMNEQKQSDEKRYQNEITELKAMVEKLQENLKGIKSESEEVNLKEINEDENSLNSQIEQLQEQIKEYQSNNFLTNQINNLNKQIFELENKEKLSKEQQQQYHQRLRKQAVEIKQLNEQMKDQQDTNNFLTNQINNLNKEIFELENKENGENEMRSENRPDFVNKGLLEVSLMEDTHDDINSSKHLQSQDQNLAKTLDLSSNQHTPAKPSSARKFINSLNTPSSTTSSSLMTPSSTQKKAVQCAQQ